MREPKECTVYILRSVTDPRRHYVGVTGGLAKRLASHNAGQVTHTARHRPWNLVLTLEFGAEDAAIRFERYLKSASGRAFARRHFA